jgi:hypothetical protein
VKCYVLYMVVGLLCTITLTCREVEPYTASSTMKGYQLNGIVRDSSGSALRGTVVSLYFYYDSVAATPTDTQQIIITDSMIIVDISVLTLQYDFVKTIFLGHWLQSGPIYRVVWDGKNWMGNPVGSGMYLIRYYVDTAVVKYSPVVIDGAATDTADERGRFSITNNNLPFGERFDYYNLTGNFKAVYKILPMIKLKFQYEGRSAVYDSVDLMKNGISNGLFIL